MVISQIFQYLTRKQINNTVTLTPPKDTKASFMASANVSHVAMRMFNSIEEVRRPEYFAYRDYVGRMMKQWIYDQQLPTDSYNLEYPEYTLCRLNENFIGAHQSMIKTPNVKFYNGPRLPNLLDGGRDYNNTGRPDNFYTISPDNVYRDKYRLVAPDSNTDGLVGKIKAGKYMMAQDYQYMDVWKSQTTYADFDFEKFRSFRDGYGYANAYIPRHIDRDPDSFGLTHRNPLEASLTNQIYGYDNDEYMRAKGIK
jgi:hypothetical protein